MNQRHISTTPVTVRLHLIDGTYELYRAHYSKRPSHTSPDGTDLKATVGLVGSLLALLHDPIEAPTHLAIAFDNPIRSFRNDLFADYKSDEGVPPELRSQFDAAEQAARAVGVVVWSMNQWEADDAMATAAYRFSPLVEQVRLLTPDKDLGQCVTERVVQVDRMRQRVFDIAAVKERLGVTPELVPDLLALVGDDADGIPGLPGFGAVTAATLLMRFGSLEKIPDDASQWGTGIRGAERLAEALRAHKEDALLYRRLATLARDVPLAEDLNALAWNGVPGVAFHGWCRRVGAKMLADRPARWAP